MAWSAIHQEIVGVGGDAAGRARVRPPTVVGWPRVLHCHAGGGRRLRAHGRPASDAMALPLSGTKVAPTPLKTLPDRFSGNSGNSGEPFKSAEGEFLHSPQQARRASTNRRSQPCHDAHGLRKSRSAVVGHGFIRGAVPTVRRVRKLRGTGRKRCRIEYLQYLQYLHVVSDRA